MSAIFLQTMRFKKSELEKKIRFYNQKDKDKALWIESLFLHLNPVIWLH